jgi:hypothetical protein
MGNWWWPLFVIAVSIAIVPVIIEGATSLTMQAIDSLKQTVQGLLNPLSGGGSGGLRSLIRLCFYMLAVILIVKLVLIRKNR